MLSTVARLGEVLDAVPGADFGIFFDIGESSQAGGVRAGIVVIGRASAGEVSEAFERAGLAEAVEANCLAMDLAEFERRARQGDPYVIEILKDPRRYVHPTGVDKAIDAILGSLTRGRTCNSEPDSPTTAGILVAGRETHPTPCA